MEEKKYHNLLDLDIHFAADLGIALDLFFLERTNKLREFNLIKSEN